MSNRLQAFQEFLNTLKGGGQPEYGNPDGSPGAYRPESMGPRKSVKRPSNNHPEMAKRMKQAKTIRGKYQ